MNKSLEIPKTAIVLFNYGAFGGAERRFSNLFLYLYKQNPGKFFFIINLHLLKQLKRIYTEFPMKNVRIVDHDKREDKNDDSGNLPEKFIDTIPDPVEVDKKTSYIRKLYWYYKNKLHAKSLFKQIEKFRIENDIKVFIGVFSGILPLVFYFDENPAKASIIFSDMDSWFTDVHTDMKKLWYRKYYSFNYALEKSDYVDLLSPYILEGLKKRNIDFKAERTSITACSFADYSKCKPGDKKEIMIAFSGRLEPDKNPMLYLQAAKEILKEYPTIKFYLMGEGSLVDEINDYIVENRLQGNISFLFHPSPPEILADTSIFISLQSGTNYPSQSVIEAMACGNAVIASNTGDTNLLINDNNGILIDLNLSSLVNAIKSLLNDKERAINLGVNGRKFVLENHTIEKASLYYTDLFIKAGNKLNKIGS